MRYWKYKGYNADNELVTGVAEGDKPAALILRLRQTGIQVYDMATIGKDEYRRAVASEDKLARLIRLRARLSGDDKLNEQIQSEFDNLVADDTPRPTMPSGPNDPAYKAYELSMLRWRRLMRFAAITTGMFGLVIAIAVVVYCFVWHN